MCIVDELIMKYTPKYRNPALNVHTYRFVLHTPC